jgi:alpha-ketoglutarate-dependent taurine dioxygenase
MKIEQLSVNIGAQVDSVQLSSIDESTFEAIQEGLWKHQVLVFRDQKAVARGAFIFWSAIWRAAQASRLGWRARASRGTYYQKSG